MNVDDPDLSEIKPVAFGADVLMCLVDDEPVFRVVGKVQRSIDKDKRYSWPAHATPTRRAHRCPVCPFLLATTEEVSNWVRKNISLGTVDSFQATVLGPRDIPIVDDPEQARANPGL